MRNNNRIKSLIFLFAILFSFSAGAYNSFRQLSKSNTGSFNQACIQPSGDATVQGDAIIFEELDDENGNEDSADSSFFILSYVLQASLLPGISENAIPVKSRPASVNPIFISIRVLRI